MNCYKSYTEHFLITVSAVTGYISVSASLLGISIGVSSSAV